MKKLHKLTLGAAMALFALTACNDEAMLPEVPQVNEPQNPEVCVLSADDFRWEGTDSRTSISIEDNYVKFAWTAGDLVGILPDQGAQVYFTIPEPEEGVDMTNKASFDGGAWALRPQNNYAAYYPFVEDFRLDRTKVPVDYTGQKQTGITAAHIGAYDYMGARAVTTNDQGAGVTFDFDHVGALVLLQFTVPQANTRLNNVTLSADGVQFTTKGTYSLASTKEEGFPITPTATSRKMTVELDYTTQEDNEEVTVYMMCAPVDLSEKEVNICVSYGDGEYVLDYTAEGKNLEGANAYALTAEGAVNLWKSTMMVESIPVFAGAINQALSDKYPDATKLRFVTESYVVGAECIYSDSNGTLVDAAQKGEWLEMYIQAKEFMLPMDCRNMFDATMYPNFERLTEIDLNGWNTSNVKYMSNMFSGCSSLTSLNLSGWDTQNVMYMGCMFQGCSSLEELDLSGWDTQNVMYMSSMFARCSSLEELDLSGWDTQNVTNMNGMFYICSSLTSLDLSGWDTQNVTDMGYMFGECSALTSLDLSSFTFVSGEGSNTFGEMFGNVGDMIDGTIPIYVESEYLEGDSPAFTTDEVNYYLYGTLVGSTNQIVIMVKPSSGSSEGDS